MAQISFELQQKPEITFKFVCLITLVIKVVSYSIQDVTGGMCETLGECSLGQTIPI